MPVTAAIGAALTGLSLLSGLFKGKQESTTNSSSSSMPTYDAPGAAFKDFLMNAFKGRVENNQGFEDSYREGGLQNIFQANKRSDSAVGDILSSRGIGRTTAGASALADNSYRKSNGVADFLSSLPMLFDERRKDNLNNAGAFFGSLPVGTSTTGTSHTTGTVGPSTIGGGIIAGSSGLASYLGQISANNQLQNILKTIGTPKPGVGTGGSIPDGTGDKSYGISW